MSKILRGGLYTHRIRGHIVKVLSEVRDPMSGKDLVVTEHENISVLVTKDDFLSLYEFNQLASFSSLMVRVLAAVLAGAFLVWCGYRLDKTVVKPSGERVQDYQIKGLDLRVKRLESRLESLGVE